MIRGESGSGLRCVSIARSRLVRPPTSLSPKMLGLLNGSIHLAAPRTMDLAGSPSLTFTHVVDVRDPGVVNALLTGIQRTGGGPDLAAFEEPGMMVQTRWMVSTCA